MIACLSRLPVRYAGRVNYARILVRWFHRLGGIANRRDAGLSILFVAFALAVVACAGEPAGDGNDAPPPGSSTADLATPAAGAYELARILPDVKIEAMTITQRDLLEYVTPPAQATDPVHLDGATSDKEGSCTKKGIR